MTMIEILVLGLLAIGRPAEALTEAPAPKRPQLPKYCAWEYSNSDESAECWLGPPGSGPKTDLKALPPEPLTHLGLRCQPAQFPPEDPEALYAGGSARAQQERARQLERDALPLNTSEFAHLAELRSLAVFGCRLRKVRARAFAGLRNLRELAIHTLDHYEAYTRDEGRLARRLEFEEGAFEGAGLVERLDLSSSNVWELGERLFCPMGNLVHLRLAYNLLERLEETGIGSGAEQTQQRQPCSADLRVLDLSHNRLRQLDDRAFSGLRRLMTLNLSANVISVVGDEALEGLKTLKYLDLSFNRIVALPANVFREAANSLNELKLQNNSLAALAPGLLANMTQLESLDLSANVLTSASLEDPATFAGLIRLVILNLAHNRIGQLTPGLFRDLYTLQILNLRDNALETILPDTFAPLSNLHTLDVSHNRLKGLQAQSLNGLFALSSLDMDFNLLESLHPEAFRNCSSIQDLNLSGNNLESVPLALRDMGILKTLDLGENRIELVERASFDGMTGLYGLRLMNNDLTNVTRDTFSELPALQILNLARNKIAHVELDAFRNNPILQAIRLDSNLLRDMSNFSNVTSLMWLNVSDNAIVRFDYEQLPPRVQWLNLNKNHIAELGPAPAHCRLRTLDLSFNRLKSLGPGSIPDSIEVLFLNDNHIAHVEPHAFLTKENLTRVDLYANQIVRMELSALAVARVPPERELPEFYIGGNPFVCDCSTEWLQRINNLTLRQHPRVMDLESVYCRLPYDRRDAFIPLLEAKSSQFVCRYQAHCFALCHCCEFDACDCEMTCPHNCTCYHDQSWAANVVDCANARYTRLPGRLPMDATEVYLDGNDFGELNSHSFIGRKNLEILYANNSNIVAVRNFTFSGLRKLAILHLEHNRIEALHGTELAPLEALRELYLQGNLLAYIHNDTFLGLGRLEVLRLDGNRLHSFALWQLAQNPYLVAVSLAGNPWQCDCGYVERARDFVSLNRDKIPDWQRVTCSLGMPLVVPANGSTVNCAALQGATATRGARAYLGLHLVLLLAAVGACSLALASLAFGLLRHRRALRAWAASRCGLRACYKTAASFEEREKPFDAYISYSALDEAFVSRVLVPGLGGAYRYCLHYRDLGNGGSNGGNIAAAVAEAADSSRRTILVLSRNFLQLEWSRFDFRLAIREALKGRGRNVILLLIGGVCPRDLDSELRRRISSHTVLVWGDKLFWQKIRFAMPEGGLIEAGGRPPSLPTPPPPPQIGLVHHQQQQQHLWA